MHKHAYSRGSYFAFKNHADPVVTEIGRKKVCTNVTSLLAVPRGTIPFWILDCFVAEIGPYFPETRVDWRNNRSFLR
jgi:hypothetical protein